MKYPINQLGLSDWYCLQNPVLVTGIMCLLVLIGNRISILLTVVLIYFLIYRALFAGTLDAILTLPVELFSPNDLASDIFQGCFVVTCTLFAFAGLVWLREQILHGGGPDWLQRGGGVAGAEEVGPQEPEEEAPRAPLEAIPEEAAAEAVGENWVEVQGQEEG